MAIIHLPPSTRLFEALEVGKPRVHNKYHNTAPIGAIYVGRGSPYGNPWIIGKHGTREEVIELFRVKTLPFLDLSILRGEHLVCFCKPLACHGDLLFEAANR